MDHAEQTGCLIEACMSAGFGALNVDQIRRPLKTASRLQYLKPCLSSANYRSSQLSSAAYRYLCKSNNLFSYTILNVIGQLVLSSRFFEKNLTILATSQYTGHSKI